jgi:hypothetical protein
MENVGQTIAAIRKKGQYHIWAFLGGLGLLFQFGLATFAGDDFAHFHAA